MTSPQPANLDPDFSLEQVAEALGMSERWVRQQVAAGAEHQRYGHKIRFTRDQVKKLRAQFTQEPTVRSITTGRRRKSA